MENTPRYYEAVSRALDHNEKYYSRKLLYLWHSIPLCAYFPKKADEKSHQKQELLPFFPNLAPVSPAHKPGDSMAANRIGLAGHLRTADLV